MTQIRSGGGAPAAVLAGSLAVFPLLDVLGLLARTGHVGELQVVADGVEAHLHVDRGDLLDRPGTAPERLFELACLDDAWFTVSSGTAPQRSEQLERVPLGPLLKRVAPHVAEWQSLMKTLPFGAVARMSPAMPGPEAQIRSDQWRILSLIGTGRPVHEVVDVSDGRPLETLRLVDELAQKKLIVVDLPPGGSRRAHPARSAASPARPDPAESGDAAEPSSVGPEMTNGAAAPAGTGDHGPREHEIVQLEIGGAGHDAERSDTGGHDAERSDTGGHDAGRSDAGHDAGGHDAEEPAPDPNQPVGASSRDDRDDRDPGDAPGAPAADGRGSRRLVGARATTTPLTAKRAGTVRASVPERAPRRGTGTHAVAAYMPPPVSPSFWPILDAAASSRPTGAPAGGGGSAPPPAGADISSTGAAERKPSSAGDDVAGAALVADAAMAGGTPGVPPASPASQPPS